MRSWRAPRASAPVAFRASQRPIQQAPTVQRRSRAAGALPQRARSHRTRAMARSCAAATVSSCASATTGRCASAGASPTGSARRGLSLAGARCRRRRRRRGRSGDDDLGAFAAIDLRWPPVARAARVGARLPRSSVDRLSPRRARRSRRRRERSLRAPARRLAALPSAPARDRRRAGGRAHRSRISGRSSRCRCSATPTRAAFSSRRTGRRWCRRFCSSRPTAARCCSAPLDHFHEQIIAVPRDADALDDGVALRLARRSRRGAAGLRHRAGAVGGADAARRARRVGGAAPPARRHACGRRATPTPASARLSYWTDNGATYYYRTAPGLDYTTTLERAVADCEARGIPIELVQIDSWFYPHEHLRPVSDEGAPIVPPSGMMRWEPREDLFPDGFADLRAPPRPPPARLSQPPLRQRLAVLRRATRPGSTAPTRTRAGRSSSITCCAPPPTGARSPTSRTGWSRRSSACAACAPRRVAPAAGRRRSIAPPARTV